LFTLTYGDAYLELDPCIKLHVTLDFSRCQCIIMHARFSLKTVATHLSPKHSAATHATSSAHADDFLVAVGKRVREARARRGMTRKQLAHEAGVSERHLAQLEGGEGNVSIVLLRRITTALNVPLENLFAAKTETPNETELIERFLHRLPSNRVQDVVSRLVREFGKEETSRRNRIALIGLRGAGKSTLGALIAREMKIPFIELDREIEKDAGMPLAEIFSLYGQSGYRRIEKRALDRVVLESDRAVISVGGGVVSEKETYDSLLANCYTIWIQAEPEEHMSRVIAQGDFRAMADNDEAMEDLRRILEAREPLYRKADLQLDTASESVEQSFSKLKKALKKNLQ
jgi:XRE family aerobic/anaerobic benzoate catabolism transcriptional regulator